MPGPKPAVFTSLVERFKDLPMPAKQKEAYMFARDIAYGDIGSRNPFDVLEKMKGTCSGKHALLKLILEDLGFEVQSWFAMHDFGKFPVSPWPEPLAQFQGKVIPDYHDFLKVKIGQKFVVIDAVFDAPLAAFGFPLLQWDGLSDMRLPVITTDMLRAEGDMEDHKKKLIAALPEADQTQRKQFLSTLTAWLDAQRTAKP